MNPDSVVTIDLTSHDFHDFLVFLSRVADPRDFDVNFDDAIHFIDLLKSNRR